MKALSFALFAGLISTSVTKAATILYSNDIMGDVEPCGCRVDPMGGVIRRSGLMARLAKESKGPFLQVDAGDFLFESKDFPESLENSRQIQAMAIVRAHDRMGLDVLVPGEKDFALGLKDLQDLFAKTKTKVLAANLLQDGKPVFPGSAVFEEKLADGKTSRIGVIGLVGETVQYPKPLTVGSRLDAFEREKAALAGKVDTIVVVSHSGLEADLEFAKKVKGVALIVGGHTQSFTQEPVIENGIPIVQASYRGQYVGVVPLETIGKPETYSLVGLDASYDQDGTAEMKKIVATMKKDVAAANRKLLKKSSK